MYRCATEADRTAIRGLLDEAGLPHSDLDTFLPRSLVYDEEGRVVACGALEPLGGCALLRSLAVAPERRGSGLGAALCDRLEARARNGGATSVYLFTTTAPTFFERRGYVTIDRDAAPERVRTSNQACSLCGPEAVCMRLDLEGRPAVSSRELLSLEPSGIAGARMWEVRGDRAALTYYDVDPGVRFERHAHDGEQITAVVAGALFFEIEGRTVRIGPGEAIVVPAGVPHAVYTEEDGARAFDAWAPPPSARDDR